MLTELNTHVIDRIQPDISFRYNFLSLPKFSMRVFPETLYKFKDRGK